MSKLGDVGSGAAKGAAMGSVVPGIGTVVGGLVGGIGGLFSGGGDDSGGGGPVTDYGPDARKNPYNSDSGYRRSYGQYGGSDVAAGIESERLGGLATAADNRYNPQGAYNNANQSLAAARAAANESSFQGNQLSGLAADATGSLLPMLQAQAKGQGPSMAQGVLQKGLDASNAQAMSQALSGRGGSGAQALAVMNAQDQAGQNNLNVANQSAQLRNQEMLQARGELSNAYGTIGGLRSQANQAFGTAGSSDNQQGGTYSNMGTNQAQLNDARNQFYQNQQTNFDQNREVMNYNKARDWNDTALRWTQERQGQATAQRGQDMQLAGAGIQAGASVIGTAAGASDYRLKDDVKEVDMSKALGHLKPYSYRYKNPEIDGNGERTGIMAQDMERSPEGKAVVLDTPRGKMIDHAKALSFALAGLANLNRRLDKVEK
jgi:hypothetical protein